MRFHHVGFLFLLKTIVNDNGFGPAKHHFQIGDPDLSNTINIFDFPNLDFYENRRLGGAQPGNRLVSFLRSYARSGCLVELALKSCCPPFSLFPFGTGELSLFSFGATSFPFSLPPTPQTSYPTLVGLIGTFNILWRIGLLVNGICRIFIVYHRFKNAN